MALNVLGISWDYFVRKLDKNTGGDFVIKQQEYARLLDSLIRIIYSPRCLKLNSESFADNKLQIKYSNSINKLFFLIDVVKITKDILRKQNIDLISAEDPVFTGFIGVILKKIYSIPLNVQIHYDAIDNDFRLRERKINYFFNFVAKWVVKRADSIRVPSENIKNKLLKLGIREQRVFVIPVRVSTAKFECLNGDKVRNVLLNNRFKELILYVGRLSREKDIPTLFKAFKDVIQSHPDALLVLAGEGQERSMLSTLAKDLRISGNVYFAGAVAYNNLPEYYAASDIFVLCSLREGRASVLVEAMLTSTPIITTKVSGASDCVVDGETGFIIDLKDHKLLSEKIMFLLDNPEIAKKFGKEGYKRFNDKLKNSNSIEALIQSWEETVRNVRSAKQYKK